MKKLSILFACLVAVLSLNSCKEDTDPQYNNPTEFKLNTPALASQYYELTADGTLDLSWSQPDYGYAAAAGKRHRHHLPFSHPRPGSGLPSGGYSGGRRGTC